MLNLDTLPPELGNLGQVEIRKERCRVTLIVVRCHMSVISVL